MGQWPARYRCHYSLIQATASISIGRSQLRSIRLFGGNTPLVSESFAIATVYTLTRSVRLILHRSYALRRLTIESVEESDLLAPAP